MKYLYPCVPNKVDINSPMLTLMDNDPNWIAEVKKNGWRCLASKNDRLTLWTRKHTTIEDRLPRLRIALNTYLPENTIIDGELMQKRTKEVKELYYAFDVILYRGVAVYKYPWHERRMILEKVIKPIEGLIELSKPEYTAKKTLYYSNIDRPDVEGIVLKKVDSSYMVGLRECPHHPYWIKVKRPEACQYAE